MPRPRKSKAEKDLANATRQRRYRQRHPGIVKKRSSSPSGGAIEERAVNGAIGKRAAHFALMNVKTELQEALARRPTGVPDSRGVIMGHELGVGHALAVLEKHLEWVKPSRTRYIA
jgi:hypothetical protein